MASENLQPGPPLAEPPVYSDTPELDLRTDGFRTQAHIGSQFPLLFLITRTDEALDDGRVEISIDETDTELAAQIEQIQLASQQELTQIPPYSSQLDGRLVEAPPPLNIVIHVVGSRGDVQPFVALGRELKKYGHRVRLATHGTFKKFVEENGLEFFDIGGDPTELMAFMVKNPGLIPGLKSLKDGDVGKRRKGMAEILQGCWKSCADTAEMKEDDPSSGLKPFIANAIIANPPSFAHIVCAFLFF